MTKMGVAYAPYERIETIWKTERARIEKSRLLRGTENEQPSVEVFTSGLARFWGEINTGAFREGKTRTQTVFFEQLCEHAGYSLDIARLAPQHPESLREAFIDARYYFQLRGDALPLAETLSKALAPLEDLQSAAVARAKWQEQANRFPELQDMQGATRMGFLARRRRLSTTPS